MTGHPNPSRIKKKITNLLERMLWGQVRGPALAPRNVQYICNVINNCEDELVVSIVMGVFSSIILKVHGVQDGFAFHPSTFNREYIRLESFTLLRHARIFIIESLLADFKAATLSDIRGLIRSSPIILENYIRRENGSKNKAA